MTGPAWHVQDAAKRARRFPSTFKVPTFDRRARLYVGDHVKLIFAAPADPGQVEAFMSADDQPVGERQWAKVVAMRVDPNDYNGIVYTGEIVSDPFAGGPVMGTSVDFGPDHVAGIVYPWDPEYPVDFAALGKGE